MKNNLRLAQAVAVALAASAFAGVASAQTDPSALKRQIDELQRQVDQLKGTLEQVQRQQAAPAVPPPGVPTGAPARPSNGYVELYGHIDVSVDEATKGIDSGNTNPVGTPAVGKLGWQPAISSNLSRLGVRGARNLGNSGLRGIFQLETQVDVTATPGTSSGDSVKGAWASRNSYLGFDGGFGAIKVGKSDAPYKLSTGRMDPFSATVGDYNSIIGNTGGDNRAEFDTRWSHAAWYESPNFGGVRFAAFWSPSMHLSTDNSTPAMGEPNCTGGNAPPCTDGSNGSVYSTALTYARGPLYLVGAYELHKDVNRLGDEAAGGGTAPLGAVGIKDESAWKAGIQYKLPTNTTLNAIYERLIRKSPDPGWNERDRKGYYVSLTQRLGLGNDFNLAWAHAGKTQGDPTLGPNPDNQSNMYAIGFKHHFDKQTTAYLVYATQRNHPDAHFDLGASGHGITYDCHDAADNCYFGGKLQAVSMGATYDF